MVKDARPIDYPLQFDSKALFHPTRPTGRYSLIGVICHGQSRDPAFHFGHYICVVRRSVDSPWYEMSDSSVWPASRVDSWQRDDAYILFYEGQDLS
jgi:ubiquitin C-terminal hydrolase